MSSGNVNLKATVTSDSSQAQQDLKKVSEGVKDIGDQAKETKGKFGELSEKFQKSPQEIVGKVNQLVGAMHQLGDAIEAVSTGDAKKFESSMGSAITGITGALAPIAPQFALVAAALSPVIVKTLDWALGISDAAEAQKQLNERLEFQNELLQRAAKIRAIEADSPAARAKIELAALKAIVDAKQKEFERQQELDKQGWFYGNEEAIKKAGDELLEARQEFSEKLAEIRKQEADDAAKADEEAVDRAEKRSEAAQKQQEKDEEIRQKYIEQRQKDDEKRQADEAKRVADRVQMHVDADKKLENSREKLADATEAAHKRMMDAFKKEVETNKKLAEEDLKRRQAAADKVVDITKRLTGILLEENKSTSEKLKAIGQELTNILVEEASKQASAAIAASFQKKAAAGAAIPGQVAEAHASIPFPLGPILAAASLAALQLLASKVFKFAEGGRVSDRVPGLGRQDNVDGKLGSDEGVLTGKGMQTTLGELLGAINRGGLGGGTVAAAPGGGNNFRLEISFADVPSDSELVRWLMGKINFRVLQQNGELVASHYHSQSGRSL